MARIPDDELERLKRETDLVALVRSRGVELKEQGKDLVGLCPFHEDHQPSLLVTPAKGLWHCLGCGKGGTVVDWVMETEKVSFRHAVEILRSGGPPPAFGAPVKTKASTVMKLAPAVELDTEDQQLMSQVLDYYHATLKTSPEALAYLKKRGLDHPEAVAGFKLGFANRTLGLRLPGKQRDDGVKIRHRLVKLGLYRPTGHEHFNGCLVIPVFDEQGNAVEVYGRKIVHNQGSGMASHLYLPGPHRGVWNLPAFRSSREVILCEALVDALTFWCAGFPNVSSTYGVNGFTADHLEVMKAYGTERVLLAFDRDEAGDRAAVELSKRLADEGVTTFRVAFPRSMDANEYALKVKPAAQSLAVVLRAAEYMAGPLPVVRGPLSDPPTPPPSPEDDEPPPGGQGPPPPAPAPKQLSSLAAGAGGGPLTEPPGATPPPAQEAASTAAPRATENGGRGTVAASPIPPSLRPDIPAEVSDQEVVIRFSDRRWRVRGLGKNLSFEQLRVNLLLARDSVPGAFHVDTLDLYAAKQRVAFLRQAATELALKEEVLRKDLGLVLLKLEELQELAIRKALEPKQTEVVIPTEQRAQALELLASPKLLDRILRDLERCGVVGEETNKLVGYLAAVSRKLDKPLAVMVQSSSAAGKSALMSAVLSFVPEEERVAYSAMTGQSLFYMGEADLEHKILAIAEEEGAERASYALKQLQSEGELSIASTGKDPSTGRLVTHEYRVKGPTALFMTTTAIDLDEELMNRCVVLTVDEDREQTRAIHRMQREAETLEGYFAELDRKELLELHRNAQRLLKPLRVVNPFARRLTFLDVKTRTRRDHLKYLALIRAIALLHQHQRPVLQSEHRGRQRPYVEVTLADIEVANRLAHEVLGRTLDELPPQTRRFLLLLDQMARQGCEEQHVPRAELRLTRAEIRRFTGWSLTQVKTHLDRLAEMEYVLVHRGGRGQSFVYELLWAGEGKEGETFLMGLLDVEALRRQQHRPAQPQPEQHRPAQPPQPPQPALAYHANLSAFQEGVSESGRGVSESEGDLSGSKRGQNGAISGGCRTGEEPREPNDGKPFPATPLLFPPESTPRSLSAEPASSYVPQRGRRAGKPGKPANLPAQGDQEQQLGEEGDEEQDQPLPLAAASDGGRR